MDARRRFRAMFAGEPISRRWLEPEGLWVRTEKRWRAEGMTDGQRRELHHDGICALHVRDMTPPFETRILRDEGETVVRISGSGQTVRTWKDGTDHDPGYQVLDSPVKDMATWEAIKPRLDPEHPDHFGPDWDRKVEAWRASDKPIILTAGHSMSVFGYCRELMGERIFMHFYDRPQLVHAVMDFLADRIARLIERVSEHVPLDAVAIWEDMAYKGASLISPAMFREFMLEPTRRICAAARAANVPAISVDSDGYIMELIPLWLEAGVNAIEPMEVNAGMDVCEVRRQFGDDFWIRGGFDKRALWHGPEEIDAEFDRLRPAIERGKYMLCVDHSVSPEASWENYQYYARRRRELAHFV